MRQTLFRQQVMDEKRNRYTGQALMRPPVSLRVMIGLCVSMFFVAIIFLFGGQYSRRERSTGIVVPSQGAVRVLAKGAGTVTSIHVQDGEEVEQNTRLFTLSNDKTLGSGEAAHQSTLLGLQGLADNLKARLESLPQRKTQDIANFTAEGQELAHQLEMLRNQKIISQNRLALQKDRKQRASALADERLISKNDFQQLSDAVLQAQSHQHEAAQAILAAEAQQRTLESKKLNLDNIYKEEEGSLLQQLATTEERITELKLDIGQVLISPVRGRLTSVQAYVGMNIDPSKPLAVILPEGSRLEVHLFVPTRAIGFLKVGQEVLLHYEAFPSQKYGMQSALIENISRSALYPSEVQEMNLGENQEAYYRVTARLDRDFIRAYGQNIALQSGMKVAADIILESRSLIEWILEPLYRARE